MKPAIFGEEGWVIIISNQFLHHLDARRAAIFGNVFFESQKTVPTRWRIASGFPGMNDAYQSILVRVTATIEPIVISLYLLIDLRQKFEIVAMGKHQVGRHRKQRRLCNRTPLRLAPEPAAIVAPVIAVRDHPGIWSLFHLTRSQAE